MSEAQKKAVGTLYIVATPIGNLDDMSFRAIKVLKEVDWIAAEDTRHSKRLLQFYDIETSCIPYHDHNETAESKKLIGKLLNGENIALISDAGTPLIHDPGYQLVSLAREKKIDVNSIPGPSAVISALSISGLPCQTFSFLGFLPPKQKGRVDAFKGIRNASMTSVFFESSHRILKALKDLQDTLGESRNIAVARELTKTYETVLTGTISEVLETVESSPNQQKGEFVLMVSGSKEETSDEELKDLLLILMESCTVKEASKLASKITGIGKNEIYAIAIKLKEK